MNRYSEIREKIQKRVNAFPMGCAFNEEQFNKMMKKWNLNPESDRDKIFQIFNGCFIRKSDRKAYVEMNEQNDRELKEALENDDILLEAFEYELENHEYCYNEYQGNYDTLTALGFSLRAPKENENVHDDFYYNNPRNFNLTEHQFEIYRQALANYWDKNQDF